MFDEITTRIQINNLNKNLKEIENAIKESTTKLKNILIEKSGFTIGDVIGGNSHEQNKMFVIRDFGLAFNEYAKEPQEELTAKLYLINKSNKIDKKRSLNSLHSEKFISKFKVLGKYDFEKDEITFI